MAKKKRIERFVPEPNKVELGQGDTPLEGFFHVDIRPLPSTDLVLDLRDPLPFEDESVAEYYSCHFLEHLDRHEIPKILGEILRSLVPGGRVKFVFPNLMWAAEALVKHPEWTPSVIEYIYGHQDYSANYHHWGFTPESASRAIKEAGFENIQFESGPVDHSIHIIGFKPVPPAPVPEVEEDVRVDL